MQQRIRLDSSAIESIRYDEKKQTLDVEFREEIQDALFIGTLRRIVPNAFASSQSSLEFACLNNFIRVGFYCANGE